MGVPLCTHNNILTVLQYDICYKQNIIFFSNSDTHFLISSYSLWSNSLNKRILYIAISHIILLLSLGSHDVSDYLNSSDSITGL